jgi:hypothetical protein
MNSLTLKQNGFTESTPLKGIAFLALPLNKSSVFALVDFTVTGKPSSDIVYIGKTKKLSKRIFGGYLSGYGGKTTRKISSKLIDDGYIEKIAVSWMLTDNPRVAQVKLLEDFKKEHGQYPTWNAPKKTPKKNQAKPQKPKKRPTAKPAKPAPKKTAS